MSIVPAKFKKEILGVQRLCITKHILMDKNLLEELLHNLDFIDLNKGEAYFSNKHLQKSSIVFDYFSAEQFTWINPKVKFSKCFNGEEFTLEPRFGLSDKSEIIKYYKLNGEILSEHNSLCSMLSYYELKILLLAHKYRMEETNYLENGTISIRDKFYSININSNDVNEEFIINYFKDIDLEDRASYQNTIFVSFKSLYDTYCSEMEHSFIKIENKNREIPVSDIFDEKYYLDGESFTRPAVQDCYGQVYLSKDIDKIIYTTNLGDFKVWLVKYYK